MRMKGNLMLRFGLRKLSREKVEYGSLEVKDTKLVTGIQSW